MLKNRKSVLSVDSPFYTTSVVRLGSKEQRMNFLALVIAGICENLRTNI